MNGEDKLNIKVKIAGREFPLTIPSKEEGGIRSAAQLITETFEKYKIKFSNEDYASILAKASLTVLVNQEKKSKMQDSSDMMDALYQMEEDMEDFISENIS
jgi:cell division protein ZapA